MIVATAAGTTPTVKNITAGTRYAAAGMVCIASSTGRRNRSKRRSSAAITPSGTPMATAMSTATSINTSVSTVGSHSPTSPGTRAATAATVAIRHRPVRATTTNAIAATPYHGRAST